MRITVLASVPLLYAICVPPTYAHSNHDTRVFDSVERPTFKGRNDEPNLYGSWSPTEQWPVLAVHAALLPTGDVLAWDATPDDFEEDSHNARQFETRVTLWDPVTNTHTETNNKTGGDLFCAGSAHLWDGRILFAGGDSGLDGKNGPLSNSNIYDPYTNTWTETDYLNAPRWYSSVAGMSNGKMFTFGGAYSPVPVGETFEFNRTWSQFSYRTPFSFSGDYAWLQASSDGSIAYLGPHNRLNSIYTDPDVIFPEIERDTDPADRGGNGFYRGYGSYAMYDIDKAIITGGGDSLSSAKVYDMLEKTVGTATPMTIGRRQHNLTILADGTILATGGNDSATDLVDVNASVLMGEIWNPDTDQWTITADAERGRQYHSVALLLPDATVLVAGGGYCPPCSEQNYHEQNAEIFSPPYLYNDRGVLADRPATFNVPDVVGYNENFTFSVDSEVVDINLVKLGSVTHSQNENQRNIPMTYTIDGNTITVNGVDRNVATPGHYMMFVIDQHGVPSMADMIKVGYPLVSSDEVVVASLQADTPDRFEVHGTSDHTLSVFADDPLATINVAANGYQYPLQSCTTMVDGVMCTVSSLTNKQWIVSVQSQNAGDIGIRFNITDGVLSGGNVVNTPTDLLTETIKTDSIQLTWTASDMAIGYNVYRDGVLHQFVTSNSFRDINLRPSTVFEYQVQAVDSNQNTSERSMVVDGRTFMDPYATNISDFYNPERPSTVGNFRLSLYPTGDAGQITWDKGWDGSAVVLYELYRNGVMVQRSAGNSYVEDNIVIGENVEYYVIAIDNDGNRGNASDVYITNGRDALVKPSRPAPVQQFVSVVDEVPPGPVVEPSVPVKGNPVPVKGNPVPVKGNPVPPVVITEPVDVPVVMDPVVVDTDPEREQPVVASKKSGGGSINLLMIVLLLLGVVSRRRFS